jgi:5-methylcytosine-specific restriction endonuclease McrA
MRALDRWGEAAAHARVREDPQRDLGLQRLVQLGRLLDGAERRSVVFKFRLELTEDRGDDVATATSGDLEQTRLIPTAVKLDVWKRDQGRCTQCGASDNLHFDHVIPYSKGGSSLVAANIQLLCARHNIEKRDQLI